MESIEKRLDFLDASHNLETPITQNQRFQMLSLVKELSTPELIEKERLSIAEKLFSLLAENDSVSNTSEVLMAEV